MTLDDQERAALEENIRAELQEEHARREAQALARREQRRSSRQDEQRKAREAEELRNALRRQFYEENGYQQATDTTGREVWLSPAEFDLHSRAQRGKNKGKRKRNRFATIAPKNLPRFRDIAFFALICCAAIAIGLMLAR